MTGRRKRNEMWIEMVALEKVKVAKQNPKLHDVQAIRKSIVEHGFAGALILDGRTNRLIAGHGRLKVLRLMKSEGVKPPAGIRESHGTWLVPVANGFRSKNDKHAAALLVADNRTSELGGWDRPNLLGVLDKLKVLEDFELTGFTLDELEALRVEVDPPDLPEPLRPAGMKITKQVKCPNCATEFEV